MLDRVTEEIESIHEFFCLWFGGRIDQHLFDEQFTSRFSQSLVFIPPDGSCLGLPDLEQSLYAAHGTNPDIRIKIRNVRVHRQMADYVLATYEEWQRNAQSTPKDNGRLATVLFRAGDRLEWNHVHESWLPRDVMEAGPYDF